MENLLILPQGSEPLPTARPAASPSFRFTGVHERILKQALSPYHLLTAKQITRLLYPTEKLGMFTTVKARLKAMTEAKYVTAAHLPTAENTRPFVYCIGQAGRKLLTQEGYDLPRYFEKAELESRSPGWYYHLLELNNFLISAATLEQRLPSMHLFDWLHDFTIAGNPPQGVKPDGTLTQVKPDAFLHFVSTIQANGEPRTRRYRYLVELDRGTESDDKLRKKFRDYLTCYKQEILQTHFRGKLLIVLFPTTAGERRVEKLRLLARAELKDFDPSITEHSFFNGFFHFASLPPLLRQPLDPSQVFCAPRWTLPYGEPTDQQTLIELTS